MALRIATAISLILLGVTAAVCRAAELPLQPFSYREGFEAQGQAAGQPHLVYTPREITNDRLSPDVFPIPSPLGKELACKIRGA